MIHSFKVATTLSAYRGVYVSAENTVAYLNTITSMPIGVTKNTVNDTLNAIPVAGYGEETFLEFNDTVAAGALLTCDANGKGVPFTYAGNTATCYLGVCLETVAATGTIAKILIQPAIG